MQELKAVRVFQSDIELQALLFYFGALLRVLRTFAAGAVLALAALIVRWSSNLHNIRF